MSKRMVLLLIATVVVFGGVLGGNLFGKYKMNQFLDNMPQPAATVSSAQAEADRWINSITAVGSVSAVQEIGRAHV